MIINGLVHHYISEQLMLFEKGNRCCQKFCGSFRYSERLLLAEYAAKLGFRSKPYTYDGVQALKVFKRSCVHYIETLPHLSLRPSVEKELFMMLCQSDFIGGQQEMQMSPEFFSPNSIRPSVPPHRFSLGLKQSMARQNNKGQRSFQKNCSLQAYKTALLNAIQNNRVLVVNGKASFEKSTGLPMYIIEDCAQQRAHCKIICVEREQLLAIYHSERLSEHLGEKVGNTVAFQVHLQSRISEGSNLIYTTSSFLLRVLMGQSIVDSFRHISHIIVSDVYRHESFADLLLCELREALRCHAHLKVVLLSNSQYNAKFIEYFGEGEIFQLICDPQCGSPSIWYMDDIRKLLDLERSLSIPQAYLGPTEQHRVSHNCERLDALLEEYELSGDDTAFDSFLYMVRGEYTSINYRHSVHGRTAIIVAAKLGKVTHLKTLLDMHADPFVMDKQNLNSISNAVLGGNAQCIEILNSYCRLGHTLKDTNPANLDYNLITDLIKLLVTNPAWEPGNILVLVSNYEQLIRLNFFVLRQKMIGNIPQEVVVHMVHNNMEKDQLAAVIEGTPECINIIIGTDILENVVLQYSCMYLIDCGRSHSIAYNAATNCRDMIYEWISKEDLENRSLLASSSNGGNATCFQLIPSHLIADLPAVLTPELLKMPLDRVCLTIKLLSQHTMIAEYLQTTINRPPFINIYHTVEHLKKMDIFDEFEEMTWLGCRLIDVPIDCQLGKLLVFAILLQCLDPVLTIVSFLSTPDPLELPIDIHGLSQPMIDIVRHKIKEERKRFADHIPSDHLIYLRMYQEWQNELRDDNPEMAISDEHDYVLNGILERVCDMRTHLVGALRSSQLIHNQGQLSMHYINLKSNNWSMIKAALVAGLYPSLCVVDSSDGRIKCNKPRELVLHPSSTLRELKLEPLAELVKNFSSNWIVYGDEINSHKYNSIKCCTIVAPLTIAMFAGLPKVNPANISISIPNMFGEPASLSTSGGNFSNSRVISHIYIDDWIEFTMKSSDALLLLKTRQYFYSSYMNFLQNCGNVDKWRRSNIPLSQISRLFDSLEKVFTYEDNACGFAKPTNVGLRPKAVPNKFITTFNSVINWEKIPLLTDLNNPKMMESTANSAKLLTTRSYRLRCLEKEYFLVYIPETSDMAFRKCSNEWLLNSVARVVGCGLSRDKLTYVISYTQNPDQFCMVTLAKKVFGIFKLQEYFKNKIPVQDVVNICSKFNICVPILSEKPIAFQIDPLLGKTILDVFAYRNNWLHN